MRERDLSHEGIVIVGGGLAGQRCAETLRREGYEGAVRMVCAEAHRPYDRPPLSKELLTGSRVDSSVCYRPEEWYEHHSIDLLLGISATKLDPARHRVALSDGCVLPYGRVLIATGRRPRTLPALEGHDNVSTLRTLDDCRRLRTVLSAHPRLAVVGGGFIGQEVAATARSLGSEVTMIEAAPWPLAGVLGPLGQWFERLHRSEGVEVLTHCTVDRPIANGAVRALRLSNGRVLAADHVLVGVGVEPDGAWLAGTPLDAAGGVRVDRDGRTAIEGVYAAGDAAATFDPIVGRHVSGSHWEAAGRQGARAARAMLGLDPGAVTTTSFWTDQYGIRIQYLGHALLADSIQVDGNPEARNFTAIFTRAGRVVAALLVDRPRSLPAARELIEKGTT
jgi:NADPH-dependent 2,4-dienoyl-CoA reductase/sulfur reductase-like enzyme